MNRLERLVDRLFDYAGMFPPAELDLHSALKESASFGDTLQRPHMVSADMVVPPGELALLNDDTLRSAGFLPEHEVKVCLVGVPLEQGTDAADRVRAFHASAREAQVPRRVVALEVADGRSLESDLPASAAMLRHIAQATTGLGVALYYEPRWKDDDWAAGLERVVELLEEVRGGGIVSIGLKVRCAGPTAVSPATLAAILAAMVDRRFPFKVTQGLHHPVVEPERHDGALGFLGVAAAHALRAGIGASFDLEAIEACLTEQDAAAFRFDDGLSYRGHALAGEAFDKALVLPFNIGSCSIHEPDEDLVRLYGAPTD